MVGTWYKNSEQWKNPRRFEVKEGIIMINENVSSVLMDMREIPNKYIRVYIRGGKGIIAFPDGMPLIRDFCQKLVLLSLQA